METKNKRTEGFYWVKLKVDFGKKIFADENFKSTFEIAEWNGNKWWLCANGYAFDESNFEEINENKIDQNSDEEQKISGVAPKFCFICSARLEEFSLGWMQCQNEKCAEVYMPYLDKDNNQCLMHQRTPFSPKKQSSNK